MNPVLGCSANKILLRGARCCVFLTPLSTGSDSVVKSGKLNNDLIETLPVEWTRVQANHEGRLEHEVGVFVMFFENL